MEDIIWATILIWFFLLAFGYARNETVVKSSAGVLGLLLTIQLMGESFLIGLAILLLNIYIVYDALVLSK